MSAPIVKRISVLPSDVGRIIGKRGKTIREIQDASRCVVEVESGSSTVQLSGNVESVSRAEKMILSILSVDKEFHVFREMQPRLRSLRIPDVFLKFPDDRRADVVTISAPACKIDDTLRTIREFIPSSCRRIVMRVPVEYHSRLIGSNGRTVEEIRRKTGVEIGFPSVSNVDIIARNEISLVGTSKVLEEGKKEVERLLRTFSNDSVVSVRSDAERVAEKRDELNERAASAYKRGYKAKAKMLAEQGKLETKKLELENQMASEAILHTKNVGNDLTVVDVHGQHEKEATRIVSDRIDRLRQTGKRSLTVVTGKGLHSSGAAVLRPAVQNWCRTHRYAFELLDDATIVIRF